MKTSASMGLMFSLLLLCGCVREVWPSGSGGDELVISFGAAPSPDVVVSTKGTLGVKQESQVKNMFIFIFDASDNKIYAHLFDESNKGEDKNYLPNYWYSSTTDTGVTSGKIFIKTQKKNGCKIVAICNINSEMVNLSPQYLSSLTTYDVVKNLDLKLNQQVYSRTGYFPMSGEITGVDFDSDADVAVPTLVLTRLDAKINFIVQACNTKTPLDENGNPTSPVPSGISNFTPMSWQVVNLPAGSYIFDKGTDVSGESFNGQEMPFETEVLTDERYCGSAKKICKHGFSFYMMESRPTLPGPQPSTWNYSHREERNGDGSFKYAPETAAYVILKGRLEITDDEAKTMTVADVKYTIHLGDFGADLGDFSVLRNHAYTYNIYIQGIEDILVEVQGKDGEYPENEPGATGDILVSSGESITCDSHYSSHAIDFYYDSIIPDKMNWWVQTPFNLEGADPENVNLSGIDYGWVEFRVNKDQMSDGKYKAKTWTTYKPRSGPNADATNPTMTVPELIQFLKEEKEKKYNNEPSAFDNEDKITVTAFVNEYYYEANPLTGQFEPGLWKRFVNQPMRTLCILSKVESSPDKESHVVSSSFTIQQHSIQTVYNPNHPDLNMVWGVEYETDEREKLCEKDNKYSGTIPGDVPDRKNTDTDNGRRNSMIEWGLMGTVPANYTFQNDKSWATYLALTDGDNSKNYLKGPYDRIRHSCLSRNRDNDGDGVIDKDEVRWYLAASNQLISLFLGSYGIEGNAGLYQRSVEERNNNNASVWRQHVLASNRASDYLLKKANKSEPYSSNNYVRTVWAEEALTGSWIEGVNQEGGNFFGRCVRNIGYDPHTGKDVSYSSEDVAPDPLFDIRRYHETDGTPYTGDWTGDDYKDVYFDIDCSRVNERSLRYYTEGELIPHDEFSEAACLYRRFRTVSIAGSKKGPAKKSVEGVNADIDASTSGNPYCPEGYRLPNIRELGIMCYFLNSNEREAEIFISNEKQEYTFARTHFSFGKEGNKFANDKWGWGIGNPDNRFRAFTSMQQSEYIRCVKDVKVE